MMAANATTLKAREAPLLVSWKGNIMDKHTIYALKEGYKGNQVSKTPVLKVLKKEMSSVRVSKSLLEEKDTQTTRFCEQNESTINTEDWRLSKPTSNDKLSHLYRTYGEGKSGDVKLIVGPSHENIYAHSFVLGLNSPVYEYFLQLDKSEGDNGPRHYCESMDFGNNPFYEILIEDVDPEILRIILKFMYTGEFVITDLDRIQEVGIVAGNKFQMTHLVDSCAQKLTENICCDTAAKLLLMARDFQKTKLEEIVMQFILSNGEAVLSDANFLSLTKKDVTDILGSDSLIVSSEVLVFEAALRWASNICRIQEKDQNPENIREVLGDLFYKIRFPLISAEDLYSKVFESDVLHKTEFIELSKLCNPVLKSMSITFSSVPRIDPNQEASNSVIEDLSQQLPRNSEQEASKIPETPIQTRRVYPNRNKKRKLRINSPINETPVKKSCRKNLLRRSQRMRRTLITLPVINYRDSESEDESDNLESQKRDSSEASDGSQGKTCTTSIEKTKEKDPEQFISGSVHPVQSSTLKSDRSLRSCMDIIQSSSYPVLNSSETTTESDTKTKTKEIPKTIEKETLGLVFPLTTPQQPMEINQYIQILQNCTERSILTTINETLTWTNVDLPKAILPNIKTFYLNMEIPEVKPESSLSFFKTEAKSLIGALKSVIFVSNNEEKSTSEFLALTSGMEIQIKLNNTVVFSSNPLKKEISLAYIHQFPMFNQSYLQNLLAKIYDAPYALERFSIVDCDIGLHAIRHIASPALEILTVLNIWDFEGSHSFLRSSPNLKELRLEGKKNLNAFNTELVLNLDEDLNLFNPKCKLKLLTLSNMVIDIKGDWDGKQSCIIKSPILFFCKFKPKVYNGLEVLFPNLKLIHIKKCIKDIPLLQRLLEMKHMKSIGVWGNKLSSNLDIAKGQKFAVLKHLEIKELLKKRAKEWDWEDSKSVFVLQRVLLKLSAQEVNQKPVEVKHWAVARNTKKYVSDLWNPEFLRVFYDHLGYSPIVDFERFVVFSKNTYAIHYSKVK